MSKGRRDSTTVTRDSTPPWLLFVVLAACVLGGCQTVKPENNVLEGLQAWATPEPIDRLSPPQEQRRAKTAMMRWLEKYLHEKYQATIVDQRFVMTEPGFTDGARIGSKANQYMTSTLGGEPQPVVWYEDDAFFSHHDDEKGYRILLWKLDHGSPRYIAMVMGTDFLPDTHERSLVGYFELKPSAHKRIDLKETSR